MQNTILVTIIIFSLSMLACESSPKVVEGEPLTQQAENADPSSASPHTMPPGHERFMNVSPVKVDLAEGAIPIAELMNNRGQYEGKLVKVTGKCVKVNSEIMGRNWVHLQDGSGENFDLTITTDENIEVGSVVTVEGTIALNKDFGAGYRYEVIMEEARVK